MESDRKSSQADIERYNLENLLRRPSLRASVSRRVSQVRRETIATPDTTCGMGCIKGQWLQSFANRTSFIFLYEVLGSFCVSYVAYFYGTITTLEKRFKFSNQTLGMIAASGEISKILICLLLSLFPPNVHKPRCLGVGVFVIILSALIFTTPHFLYGPGREWHGNATQFQMNLNHVGNCTDSYPTCGEEKNKNALSIFLLTQILHGIGGGLYQTQGESYKDDNIHLHQSPSLISLLSILKALGPAIGYWLSSVCLKTHVSLEKVTEGNETQWIGAWWSGNLVIAFNLCLVGLLLVLFPPTLPKAAVRRIFKSIRGRAEAQQNPTNRGIITRIKSSLTSPAFNSTIFTGTFNVVGFLAYFIFLPKYVEIQYKISASTANLTAGTITLISAAFGIVLANSVITRYRPNARALASWAIIVGILSTCGLLFYPYLGCTENDSQIKSFAPLYSRLGNPCGCGFHSICTKSEVPIPSCLLECNFSLKNDTKVHKNCNIIFIKDLCPVDCYSNFLLFIIVTCSITFIYATGQTSNFWLEIKCPDNKPQSMHLFNILAFILAPIIFGYILDKNCLMWNDNCTSTGNCWLYNNENLRYIMNFTAIGYAIIGIIYNMGVWHSVKNMTLIYDDVDDADDEYMGPKNEI